MPWKKPSGGTISPLAPTIGSHMIAAIWSGPSYQITSSTCASAFWTSFPKSERYGSGLRNRTIPGIPGSFAQRRLSPPAVIDAAVCP